MTERAFRKGPRSSSLGFKDNYANVESMARAAARMDAADMSDEERREHYEEAVCQMLYFSGKKADRSMTMHWWTCYADEMRGDFGRPVGYAHIIESGRYQAFLEENELV